jgi:hypothetical protein
MCAEDAYDEAPAIIREDDGLRYLLEWMPLAREASEA